MPLICPTCQVVRSNAGGRPKRDIGGKVFGEFLGGGPLRFEAAFGKTPHDTGLGKNIARCIGELVDHFGRHTLGRKQAGPCGKVTEVELLFLYSTLLDSKMWLYLSEISRSISMPFLS